MGYRIVTVENEVVIIESSLNSMEKQGWTLDKIYFFPQKNLLLLGILALLIFLMGLLVISGADFELFMLVILLFLFSLFAGQQFRKISAILVYKKI